MQASSPRKNQSFLFTYIFAYVYSNFHKEFVNITIGDSVFYNYYYADFDAKSLMTKYGDIVSVTPINSDGNSGAIAYVINNGTIVRGLQLRPNASMTIMILFSKK